MQSLSFYRSILIRSVALALVLITVAAEAGAQQKEVVGWLEKVRLLPGGIDVHAMLNTASDNSLLNVESLKYIKKSGVKMVRFTVVNRYGKEAVFTLPYDTYTFTYKIDETKVKNKRPIVRIGICIGTTYVEEKVALRKQSRIEYQMSLGRSAVSGRLIIDPSSSFSLEPDCAAPAEVDVTPTIPARVEKKS
jgi:hypothetical protein